MGPSQKQSFGLSQYVTSKEKQTEDMIFKFLKKSTAFSFNDSNFFFFNPVLLLVSSELRIQPID